MHPNSLNEVPRGHSGRITPFLRGRESHGPSWRHDAPPLLIAHSSVADTSRRSSSQPFPYTADAATSRAS